MADKYDEAARKVLTAILFLQYDSSEQVARIAHFARKSAAEARAEAFFEAERILWKDVITTERGLRIVRLCMAALSAKARASKSEGRG